MSIHQPITSAELETLKTFWTAEDERNGGKSDCSRCIAEIERLQESINEERRLAVVEAMHSLTKLGMSKGDSIGVEEFQEVYYKMFPSQQ